MIFGAGPAFWMYELARERAEWSEQARVYRPPVVYSRSVAEYAEERGSADLMRQWRVVFGGEVNDDSTER